MRISDWSSDVCSSDLRLVTQGKGLFKIVGFMNGLGLPTPKRRLSVNPEAWKNRKVYIDTGMSEPYRGRPATSQIDGYSRYVSEDEATTEAAVVDGPTVEVQDYGAGALGGAIEAAAVKAFGAAEEGRAGQECGRRGGCRG